MSVIRVKCHKLQNILKNDYNQKCADCGSPHVEWASMKFGVFICTLCASFHRKLGAHITKVKNLRLDAWDERDVENMAGNRVAQQMYEKYVPVWYRRLIADDSDPQILREHWIRAKYEREEFKRENVELPYASDNYSIQLQKKGRDNNVYRTRKFVVLESSKTLSYYIKDREIAECTFNISDIEMALAPKSMEYPSSMQLCVQTPTDVRNIFVTDENSEKIVNLYMSIRRCKLLHLQIDFPHWPTERIMCRLPCDFTIEGCLWKTGPRSTDEYRKRWVTLMKRRVMYYKNQLDPTSRGQFTLESNRDNHAVGVIMDDSHIRRKLFPFHIHTPTRVYHFAATGFDEQQKWINAVNWTISREF